jgi:hydroxypyruvate isomerase
MKFSLADWAFSKGDVDVDELYRSFKAMGYDAVEMSQEANWSKVWNADLKMLNLSGPGMQKGLNRIEHHAELIPEIREKIILAGENNIPYVIVFSGNRDGQSDEEGIKNCVCAFEQLLDDCKKYNVTLLFEMLNSILHVDYQADSSGYGFTLARKLNSQNFKLIYDIFHMEVMGCDSVKDVVENLDLIGHIHLAESPDRGLPMADGNIKYSQIVPKILAAGYCGYWGMEFLPNEGQSLTELKIAIEMFKSFEDVTSRM